MKCLGTLSIATLLAGLAGGASGTDLRPGSLAGLSRLGAVIVTVATDTVAEEDVRQVVEDRLAEADIVVDGEPGPELVVAVTAERRSAENGTCECARFSVSLGLRERVTLERNPDLGPVTAFTWQTAGRGWRFSTAAPRQMIMDGLDENMSAFLRAVASHTQQDGRRRQVP